MRRIVRIQDKVGIRLAIRKQSDANTVAVADRVLKEVEEINQQLPMIRLVPLLNSATYIQRSIDNVTESIYYGGSLAILVLLVFLRNLRSTIVIALAIPISIIATFTLIYFAGFTLNLMTLGGLALGVGMMVDNAIVVLENIFRRRHELGEDKEQGAVHGAAEVGAAIVASTLTTLVIFLPLIFVQGTAGVLFKQLALVITFSLICSLLVALSLVPMLASKLVKTDEEMDQRRGRLARAAAHLMGRGLDHMDTAYGNLVRTALRWRWTTLGVSALLLAGSLLLAPLLGTEFLPPTDEGEVRVALEWEPGTRIDLVEQRTRDAEKLVIAAAPEAEAWFNNVGPSFWRASGAASGDIRLRLKPRSQRQRSNVEIADAVRETLKGRVPGATVRVTAPQGLFVLNRLLGEGGMAVEVRGFSLETLDALAAQVREALRDVPGINDIRLSREAGVPQALFRIDRDKAADLGLSVRQVAQTLETAVAGSSAGNYRVEGDEFRILVRIADAERRSLDEILDLTIANDRGQSVLLRNIVTTQTNTGPTVIDRRDQQRINQVTLNISGRDMGSIARDVLARLEQIPRPAGYEFSLVGDYEEQQESFQELLVSLALSLLLVYMVLACLYESLRDPLIVMFSVPLAAIGVVLILFLTDTTLNVQSFIGCIMLGGIVVNNAILIVDQAGQLRKEGMAVFDAVAEAGRRRLRPILMTTLTTLLGLLPLALGIGEGAEAQAPLARAVIGGLTVSTLITLVLIPAVYSIFHPQRKTA
jgi:HAE1 family hydrophobic/amphiphilic exporter-1